jgi:hypothetical protein
MKAGLHVYCEKMMSNTIDGARSMRASPIIGHAIFQPEVERDAGERYSSGRNRPDTPVSRSIESSRNNSSPKGECGMGISWPTAFGAWRLALCFRFGFTWGGGRGCGVRGLGGFVLHAFFKGAEAFADPFAKLRQFLRPEDQQGYSEDEQQMCRLK